jgi:fatty acid desaturase
MAWGVRLYVEATPDLDRRLNLLAWLVGLDLAHDLLLAPAVVLVGFVVRRVVPARARAAVQVALVLSAFVLLVGLLPLLGTAGGANPTIQPIAYGPSIAAVLAAIWLAAAAAIAMAGHPRSFAIRKAGRRRRREARR